MMSSQRRPDPWFSGYRADPRSSVRLFCFPYAGGGAHIFQSWATKLPSFVEIWPVQLPGRGERFTHPPFTDTPSLIDALSDAIEPYLNKPFAFFGHSMGAIIGFELALHLRRLYGRQPAHLFLSGSCAPRLIKKARPIYDLPEPQFLKALKRLNGTPKEFFEHPELIQLLIPALRADFAVCQTYVYTPSLPLDCPVNVFGGLDDKDVNQSCLKAWREHTSGPFSVKMFPGGHFFFNTAQTGLLKSISLKLNRFKNGT